MTAFRTLLPALWALVSLGAAGCGLDFAIDSVTPSVTAAFTSQELTVAGAGFTQQTRFTLVADGVEVACPTLSVSDEGDTATVSLPGSAPAGVFEMVGLRDDGATTSLEEAVILTAAKAHIRFIDVGQGDATLLETPDGDIVLIDGGKVSRGGVVKAALDNFSGGRVDVAIVSHFDEDHLGGWVEVLMGPDGEPGTSDDVNVTAYGPADTGSCTTQVCGRMRALASPLTTPDVGQALLSGDDWELLVVAVGGVTELGPVSGVNDENERSLAVLFTFADRTVLINGDLTGGGNDTADVETPLSQVTGPVDVLRTGHHGSKTSSNADALANWSPRLSVISAGTDNTFCHPDNDVLGRIAASSTQVWVTGNGVIDSIDRCDATVTPANGTFGVGDVDVEVFVDGRIFANDATF